MNGKVARKLRKKVGDQELVGQRLYRMVSNPYSRYDTCVCDSQGRNAYKAIKKYYKKNPFPLPKEHIEE